MFYTIAILLLFSVVLILFEHKSRYSYLFVMMALGCVIAFFALVLHINAFGNYYVYSESTWFRLDYKIYSYMMGRFRIPLTTEIRLMNIGHFLYLISMPMFCIAIRKSMGRYKAEPRWVKICSGAGFVLPFFMLVFCDPVTSTNLYVLCHRNTGFFQLLEGFTILYKLLIQFAIFSPVLLFLQYGCMLQVRYLRKRIFLLALCLLLLDLGFVYFFYVGPFSISAEKVRRSGFWVFENVRINSQNIYFLFPLIVMALLSLCMVVLLSFSLDFGATPFFNRKVQRNLKMMNEVLGDTLHSQKNTLFTLQLLTNKAAEKTCGCCQGELERIRELLEHSLENTTRMLDNLRQVNYRFFGNDLLQIVQNACRNVFLPEQVQLELFEESFCSQSGRYDKYHLEKAFVNILNNAVEALGQSGKPQGRIQVEMAYFFHWVVVVFSDNGTGIPKHAMKKLFLPHYSNKDGRLNWGLGLPYVYKVVKAHLGQIKIDSKYGEYTSVLIFLPLK